MPRTLTASLAAALALGPLSCSAVDAPPAPPEPARRAGHALSADLMGINVSDEAPGGDAIAELGAGWVRIELRDPTTGPELSHQAIDRTAANLADYHARGIQVLLVLDYMTHAGFGGGGAFFCPPQGDWGSWRAGFLSRVAHAAATFGDAVDAWQVWNEPDHPCGANPGYEPYVPPEEFGPLQRDAFAAIRGGSSRPVVLGGLESGDATYMDEMVWATGGSLSDYADGVGVQIYGVVPDDDWCVPGGAAEGELLDCAWGRHDGKVHEYFERSGGLPVWVTEVGFRTEDHEKQARYLEDAYHAFASAGDRLARVFWFGYSDAMVAPFGLTDASWQPKPHVYERYQVLAGVQPGGDPAGAGSGGEPASATSGGEPGGATSGGDSPPSCGDLAAQNGWAEAYCEWNGNGACGGQGEATWDCDHCCQPPAAPPPDPSCGDLAAQNGWQDPLCEWNGNGACGGQGTPTWDCDVCCEG